MPGPDEAPQTFETVAPITAASSTTRSRPDAHASRRSGSARRRLYLAGTDHHLAPGDTILIVGAERERYAAARTGTFGCSTAVEPDDERGRTRHRLARGPRHRVPRVEPAADEIEVFVFRRRAALFGHNAPDARLLSTNGTNLAIGRRHPRPARGNDSRSRARRSTSTRRTTRSSRAAGSPSRARRSGIGRTSLLGYVELYRAEPVSHRSRSDFGLSSKVTHVELDTGEHLDWFGLRDTLVLAESEELPLAERPVRAPLYGDARRARRS